MPKDVLVLRHSSYLVYLKPGNNYHVWKYASSAGGYTDLIILDGVDDRGQIERLELTYEQTENLLEKIKLLRKVYG